MPVYMNWGASEPPKIQGDVNERGHARWIELQSVSWGLQRSARAEEKEASAPTFSEIIVTKLQDKSSHSLFREAMSGQPTDVTIDFVKTDEGGPLVWMKYKLVKALISSHSMSGSAHGENRPIESFSINFTKLDYGPGVTPHTGNPPATTYPGIP